MATKTSSTRETLPSTPPEAWEPLLRFARLAGRPLESFLRIEAASGVLLLVAAAIALVWANSRWAASYEALWHMPVAIKVGGFAFERSLEWVVNDGLMVIFFFVVGLEIRREIHHGELSEWRRAALPAAAALGGMVVPALLYLGWAGAPATRSGWAVPMATDIAFAVGILTVLGRRVPPALRVLLLALAVIDDLGAIIVIALFYTHQLSPLMLLGAAACLVGLALLNRAGVKRLDVYLALGLLLWLCVLKSGVHATLAGVAFTPDLYSAAVAIVAPSNLITLLESIPPYWEAGRKIFHERMGDPTTPEGRKQLERQSPLNSAGKIRTPLLVVQGANDPRVKQAESDQIVIALRDRSFPVEYLVAPDEGHGFARPVNSMAMFAAAEKFLAKHLGARFQKDMTPEVEKRLTEITVDPKTVVLTKKVDPSKVGAPKPVADLAAGTSNYAVKIEMGGKSIAMSQSTSIKEEGGAWVITDTAKTPQGEIVDTTTVEKGSLTVKKRNIQQGPVTIALEFTGDKASGSMSMGEKAKPIDVALGGPVFADGAGSYDVLARLPLEAGYSTTFRNFDVMKQKVSLLEATVIGPEEVTVPAGTFKTLKVEVKPVDGEPGGQTVWIAPDTRKVVKYTALLPQMGGATLSPSRGTRTACPSSAARRANGSGDAVLKANRS